MTIERAKHWVTALVNLRTDGDGETAVVELIDQTFRGGGAEIQIFAHGLTRASAVLTVPGRNRSRSLAFVGHIDTVPVSDAGEWRSDPFVATEKEGRIYGRGAVDMKGGDAAMLMVLEDLLAGDPPACDVKFCFTADEESTGFGVVALRDAGVFEGCRGAVVCEPSDLGIGTGEKGALWLSVTAEGLSAHGSRPDLGVNAIDALCAFAQKLRAAVETAERHPLLGGNTCSLNTLGGGVKTNVIPDSAAATFDIRTIPGADHAALITGASDLAREAEALFPGAKLAVEVANNRPAVGTAWDHPFVRDVRAAAARCGVESAERGFYFYTDASQFALETGVPFVILGPGESALCHRRDEWVSPQDVTTAAAVYRQLITALR